MCYAVLGQLLEEIHEEFGISRKVVATITDNGSNFVKAFQQFGAKEFNSPVTSSTTITTPAVGIDNFFRIYY